LLRLGRSGSREYEVPLARVFANRTKAQVFVRFELFGFFKIEQRFSTADFRLLRLRMGELGPLMH
jgi:hypothetical protein